MTELTKGNTYAEMFPSILTIYAGVSLSIGIVWLALYGKLGMCMSGLYMIAMGGLFKINDLLIGKHLENSDSWGMRVEPGTQILGVQCWNWFLVFLWNRIVVSVFASKIMETNPIPVLLFSYAVATMPLCLILAPDVPDRQWESVYPRHIIPFLHVSYTVTLFLIILGLNGIFGVKTVFFIAGILYIYKSIKD